MKDQAIVAPGGASPSANSVTTDDGSSQDQFDPQIRAAFVAIGRHAHDIGTLLDLSMCHKLEGHQQEAAVTSAQGLAAMVGAIAAAARGEQTRNGLDVWLLRGAA